MRIVGGSLSGRKIEPPLSTVTRPMMDRVREALFNILAHRDWGKHIGDLFDEEGGLRVLDSFCGTGALALEAISWGAAHATLFDLDAQALKIARQNATTLGVLDQCQIIAGDATHPPKATAPCQLAFFAPPYKKGLIPPAFAAMDAAGWIAPHAVIVAETEKKEPFEVLPGCELIVSRTYGIASLHFMKR